MTHDTQTSPLFARYRADMKAAAAPEMYEALKSMTVILRRIQDTLSRHVWPDGDLQDPLETVNELLKIADHQETLQQQREALAALAKAKGEL